MFALHLKDLAPCIFQVREVTERWGHWESDHSDSARCWLWKLAPPVSSSEQWATGWRVISESPTLMSALPSEEFAFLSRKPFFGGMHIIVRDAVYLPWNYFGGCWNQLHTQIFFYNWDLYMSWGLLLESHCRESTPEGHLQEQTFISKV